MELLPREPKQSVRLSTSTRRVLALPSVGSTECWLYRVSALPSVGSTECRIYRVSDLPSVGSTECRIYRVLALPSAGSTECWALPSVGSARAVRPPQHFHELQAAAESIAVHEACLDVVDETER